MKTVKFYTVGCKVNQYETQAIREQFIQAGFQELEDSQPTDIYVINTCTVTQAADRDSLQFIARAKKENPQAKIIVAGCLAELDEDKIKEIARQSIIIKNRDKQNIAPDQTITQTQNADAGKGITYFKNHTRAFLKIQDGCNNFCSYCKVSGVRGPSHSRPLNEIIAEAKTLAKNGFKEIVLCGICLGAYGRDLNSQIGLVDVISQLEKIDTLLRIRLSSLEPQDVSDRLLQYLTEYKKLCPHLHIPLQSGDDEILKRMKRSYSHKDYLGLIKKIKTKIPEIAITTDVLVGFPGESDLNFQNTLAVVKEIIPLKVHIFAYSRRQGTYATQHFIQEELKPEIIKQRVLELKEESLGLSLIYKKQFLHKKMSVLIEGCTSEDPNLWQGYTDNYIRVKVKSSADLKNQMLSLILEKLDNDSVWGGQ